MYCFRCSLQYFTLNYARFLQFGCFVAVLLDITRRGVSLKKDRFYTHKMTAIKKCLKQIHNIRINGNETANNEAKDMQRMATTRLPYTDNFPTIRRARKFEWQRKLEVKAP